MRAALILGPSTSITRWQFEALQHAVADGLVIAQVLNCTDGYKKKLRFRNAAYYALAVLARRRMPMVSSRDVRTLIPMNAEWISFESEWEGLWQRIPRDVSTRLSEVDVAIRFGMNLIRDPQSLPLKHGILSYHHGDPEHFRGRPAVFYEQLEGVPIAGVIVQRLSNTLDGGVVLARGFSRMHSNSYAKSLDALYETGIPLLSKAIAACTSGETITRMGLGENYTLPTNGQVLKVFGRMVRSIFNRLTYGALQEKRWQVAFLSEFDLRFGSQEIDVSGLLPIGRPRGYTFAADPIGERHGAIYCEVMNSRTGKGEIARFADNSWSIVDIPLSGVHASYPQIVLSDDAAYLFPEIAQSSAPRLFRLDSTGLICSEPVSLLGLESLALIDATLALHEGTWYLFAGLRGTAENQLHLWSAADLLGPWSIHPMSPICLNPEGARMAGPLIVIEGSAFRIGQDGSTGYGRGLRIFRIESLSKTEYREHQIGAVTLRGAFGPHSLLLSSGGCWLDFYSEAWTPLAGVRRLLAKINS